jgi:hypothetical protein
MSSAGLCDGAVRRTCARGPRTTRESTARRWATWEPSTTTRVGHTTILTQASRRIGVDNSRRIDTDRDPREHAFFNAITKINVVEHRVGVLSFLGEDAVVGVEEQLLRVGGVGLDGFGVGNELLVEEELADVRDVATCQSLILLVDGRIDVCKDCMRVSKKRGDEEQAYHECEWCVQYSDRGKMYRTAGFHSRWRIGYHDT